MQVLKPVVYQGGLVRFSIPAHWTEEYDPDGGGTFYDPAVDALTLRLQVVTARSPKPIGPDDAARVLRLHARAKEPIEQLADGQALLIGGPRLERERGARLQLHLWELARAIPPDIIRIAVFATTVLARKSRSEAMRATLALLLDEVRDATISDWNGPE